MRCIRRGHYWLQRMDGDLRVQVFCRRCGRIDRSILRVPPLRPRRSN